MDADGYAVQLVPGDVLGVSVTGAADSLRVYDPVGRLVAGSSFDGGLLYPAASPLPRGGNATAEHVAAVAGRHTVIVGRGDAEYTARVGVFRPYPEGRPAGTVQTLVLDFDGATVDPAIFGAPGGPRALSPFASFLPKWGLTAADEQAVIDVAVASVRRSFIQASLASGNPRSGVRVVVARDGADPWGGADVSRVVIGGTRAEIGFHTVGQAQSLDPGNYAAEETSVILLDLLSDPAGPPLSLNTYFGSTSDRIRFVGQVLGKVITHEMAHSVGSWHTTRLDNANNVMDEGGGRYDQFFGVGPDGLGGTADDVRPLFGPAPFSTFEGLSGTQDSATRTAWGLSIGQRR
jgi:hypothetical protein